MAALINAASAGKLEATEHSKYQGIMAPPEAVSNEPKKTNKVRDAPKFLIRSRLN